MKWCLDTRASSGHSDLTYLSFNLHLCISDLSHHSFELCFATYEPMINMNMTIGALLLNQQKSKMLSMKKKLYVSFWLQLPVPENKGLTVTMKPQASACLIPTLIQSQLFLMPVSKSDRMSYQERSLKVLNSVEKHISLWNLADGSVIMQEESNV